MDEADENGYFEPRAVQEDDWEQDQEPEEFVSRAGHASDEIPSIATYVRENRSQLVRRAKQSAKLQGTVPVGPSVLEKYEYLWNLRQEVQQPIVVVPTPPIAGAAPVTVGTEGTETGEAKNEPRVQHESTLKFAPDCPEFIGEPVVVVTTFAIGLVTFMWGLFAAFRYWYTGDQNMGRIWWQMSVAIMLLTLMSLVLPPRLRFGYSLYGLMSAILIMQYAIFAFAFPLVLPSSDDLAAIRTLRRESQSAK